MSRSRRLVTLGFLGLSTALPWDGAKPTQPGAADEVAGWTPKPTAMAMWGGGSESPAYYGGGLVKRAFSDQLCGYVSADVDSPWTCDYSLAWCTTSTGWIGCCYWQGTSSVCGYRTACVDYSAYSTGCNSACRVGTVTRKCTDSTAPFCAYYAGTEFGGASVYGCVAAAPTNRSILLNSGLTASVTRLPPSTSAVVVTITSIDNVGGGGASPASSSSAAASASASSTTTAAPGRNDSSNAGAIAGGVVGGIAVLTMGLLGLYFILRKKDEPASNVNGGIAGVAPGGGGGGQQVAYAALPQQQQQMQQQQEWMPYSPVGSPVPYYEPPHDQAAYWGQQHLQQQQQQQQGGKPSELGAVQPAAELSAFTAR
ncbi:hypothetical protein FN846DRAFT_941004 [Sphaerosporella brunnea]|uniref:Mid2 domain-containing protein n=1 Tax=Sphaerosporella brunnea TaxID=1250544 RepID=A0A5J5F1G4_9PEZI|nr:hypothetical protein FN846DRAFT_941004 [Sphaerosporella brunnea]